jgi:hypothetical protein
MPRKVSTITVTFPYLGRPDPTWTRDMECYRVEKVTDSVEFDPMQLLSKAQVQQLCSAPSWRVTVLPSKER